MESICRFYKFGFCKFKETCKKHHVEEECKKGMYCEHIKTCGRGEHRLSLYCNICMYLDIYMRPKKKASSETSVAIVLVSLVSHDAYFLVSRC